MDSGSTRAALDDVFSSVSESGFGKKFLDRLAPDLVFTATGTSPLAGRYTSKAEYSEKVLARLHERLATPIRPAIEQMLVDGEWATVRFRSEGVRGHNGADFSMQYCWLIRVIGDRIVEIIGFYDTKKMIDLFA
ncbi:nuclear transport factor 2 family protein [Streptantibioticus ferralitis]|uniref:Nuclear transport factor 2 family protein n=1 Tax=Streptantibioticus ferralitis TaxID=236510 RepID=A0ABT5ZB06_9ACTN|nr:nuclear transport factor 2 family protein [Streptantibioticus ferralitis]MDF2261023.1 nuclear transport factor 2 family protein [Streptantibioticus ferralitis]